MWHCVQNLSPTIGWLFKVSSLYEKNIGQVYHPGKSSSLRLGKKIIANFGELHPILLKTMDINLKVRQMK